MAEDKKSEEEAPAIEVPEDDDEGVVEEGAPAWMATFSDLVTLIMCFFVLLFAMSSTQQETFKELVESMRSALGSNAVPEAGFLEKRPGSRESS